MLLLYSYDDGSVQDKKCGLRHDPIESRQIPIILRLLTVFDGKLTIQKHRVHAAYSLLISSILSDSEYMKRTILYSKYLRQLSTFQQKTL